MAVDNQMKMYLNLFVASKQQNLPDLMNLSPPVNTKVQSALNFLERNVDYFDLIHAKGFPTSIPVISKLFLKHSPLNRRLTPKNGKRLISWLSCW